MSRVENTTGVKKIFVGNVPFQCTREEFIDCFKDFDGFITADIIRRYRSKLSRGFGFVVFSDKTYANKLLDGQMVVLKDRILRFSVYDTSNKEESDQDHDNYQVYLNNFDKDITYDKLLKLLEKYDTVKSKGSIESCTLNSKNEEKYAIVTLKSDKVYYEILEANDKNFDAYPYMVKTKKPKVPNSRTAYREGFNAGQIVGYKQGVLETLKKLQEKSNKN